MCELYGVVWSEEWAGCLNQGSIFCSDYLQCLLAKQSPIQHPFVWSPSGSSTLLSLATYDQKVPTSDLASHQQSPFLLIGKTVLEGVLCFKEFRKSMSGEADKKLYLDLVHFFISATPPSHIHLVNSPHDSFQFLKAGAHYTLLQCTPQIIGLDPHEHPLIVQASSVFLPGHYCWDCKNPNTGAFTTSVQSTRLISYYIF